MSIHRVETTVTSDGTLTLTDLPSRSPSPDRWRNATIDRVEEAEMRVNSWEWQMLTVFHSPYTQRLLYRMKSPLSKRLWCKYL
jgi:hypothetical protein